MTVGMDTRDLMFWLGVLEAAVYYVVPTLGALALAKALSVLLLWASGDL